MNPKIDKEIKINNLNKNLKVIAIKKLMKIK